MTTLVRQNAMTPQQWKALFETPCHAVIIEYPDSDDEEEVTSAYKIVPYPAPATLNPSDD